MRDDSAEILFQSFLWEAAVSRSGMGRDMCFFDVVHPPALPLHTTASPTLQSALKDGFGEAVAVHDTPWWIGGGEELYAIDITISSLHCTVVLVRRKVLSHEDGRVELLL